MFLFVREDYQTETAGKKNAINVDRNEGWKPLNPTQVNPPDPQGSMQTQVKKHGKQATAFRKSDKGKGETDMGNMSLTQNRKAESRTDQRLVSMSDWLDGTRKDQPKKVNKENNTPDHTTTAQRKSQDHQDDKKTTQNTSREGRGAGESTSRSWFYLVGQWANRTGWPDQYNWTLGTYIHQSPLL